MAEKYQHLYCCFTLIISTKVAIIVTIIQLLKDSLWYSMAKRTSFLPTANPPIWQCPIEKDYTSNFNARPTFCNQSYRLHLNSFCPVHTFSYMTSGFLNVTEKFKRNSKPPNK